MRVNVLIYQNYLYYLSLHLNKQRQIMDYDNFVHNFL
jgi:hypothetical protein